MPVNLVNEAMKESKRRIAKEKINNSDLKAKAKIVKSAIKEIAAKHNIIKDLL